MQAFNEPSRDIPLVILPAAGFGRRVGSPESKELFADAEQRPLIEWSIQQALARQWAVHVIVRSGKQSLIEYLKLNFANQELLSVQIIAGSREWPDTLLLSQEYWHPRNIVILPDTRFRADPFLEEMNRQLLQSPVSYGCFSVHESKAWGSLEIHSQGYEIFEKCTSGPGQAWGVLGFQKNYGRQLLEAHLGSTLERRPLALPIQVSTLPLQDFVDLTRIGDS